MNPDELQAAWNVIGKDLWVLIAQGLITTIAVSLIVRFWARIWTPLRGWLGIAELPAAAGGAGEWRDTDVARSLSLPVVRAGLTVPEGTRLVVVDRGVVQFDFPAGTYSHRAVNQRLAKHDVGSEAVVLQVPTTDVLLERTLPIGASDHACLFVSMRLGLSVDPLAVARLATSASMSDGVLTQSEVSRVVDDVAARWLTADAGGHRQGGYVLPEQVIRTLHESLGLVGRIQRVPDSDAAHEVTG